MTPAQWRALRGKLDARARRLGYAPGSPEWRRYVLGCGARLAKNSNNKILSPDVRFLEVIQTCGKK